MSITDRTRKLLWGPSGNRCAICKRLLVMREIGSDDVSIVGDECHIVSSEPGGPRYDPHFPKETLDADLNLLLLCKIHHTQVDDQVSYYDAERLRNIKRDHLNYVRKATQPLVITGEAAPLPAGVDVIEKQIGTLWSRLLNEPEEIEVVRFRGGLIAEVRQEDVTGTHWYELYQVPANRFLVYYKHNHRGDFCRAALIGTWGEPDQPLSLEQLQVQYPAVATRAGLSRLRVLDL
jgi:hypothetical protein